MVVGSSPTRGARRGPVGAGAGLALAAALWVPAPTTAQPEERPDGPRTHLRLRGRHIYTTLTDDITTQRLTVWTHTRVGERVQIRGVWDVGETRVHDLWVQYRVNDWLRVRAGRAPPLWMPEFTDAPFAWQQTYPNPAAGLTRPRENALMSFVDRGRYTGVFHLLNGSGFDPENNGFKDVVAGVGRFFGDDDQWKLDFGHYEGRDGVDAEVIRRQTAAHLDGEPGPGQTIRAVVFRNDLGRRQHFGGFVRVRRFIPAHDLWGAIELGTETNHPGPEGDTHRSRVVAGVRYQLPWTQSHLTADYRRRFGAVRDNTLLVMVQWVLDFRSPFRP